MESSHISVFSRDDTFFGVCEALGEDFGFNPLYLRLALGFGLLWNPLAVIAAYAGAGLLVAALRFIAPDPRPAGPIEAGNALVETPIAAASGREHADGAHRLMPAAA